MPTPSVPHTVNISSSELRGDEWFANMRKAAAEKRKVFGTSAFSMTADMALEVLPPKDVGFSNSVASGGGQVTVDMLGGPEETLG